MKRTDTVNQIIKFEEKTKKLIEEAQELAEFLIKKENEKKQKNLIDLEKELTISLNNKFEEEKKRIASYCDTCSKETEHLLQNLESSFIKNKLKVKNVLLTKFEEFFDNVS